MTTSSNDSSFAFSSLSCPCLPPGIQWIVRNAGTRILGNHSYYVFFYFITAGIWLGERARPGSRFWRRAGFVPKGQPEISQTRSVWFIVQSKSVLKGRRKSIVLSGRTNIADALPATSWLANFHASLRDSAAFFMQPARQNATALCPIRPPQTAICRPAGSLPGSAPAPIAVFGVAPETAFQRKKSIF